MPSPWPQTDPSPAHRAAYADAEPRSFWLDSLPDRPPHEPLTGPTDADLCIIGGGYTGLWAALAAKAADPTRDVVVLEATRCGNGASGRNGGFLEASLTHGLANGLSRFPDEIAATRERSRQRTSTACAPTSPPTPSTATTRRPGSSPSRSSRASSRTCEEEVELTRRFGHDVELLDAERDPRGGQLADVPRGGVGPHRLGARAPRPSRRWPAGRRPPPGRPHP